MNKGKSRDIIYLIIATLVIIGSAVAIWLLLFPPKNTNNQNNTEVSQDQITGVIDQTTFDKINSLADYGQPDLSGLGKGNLFADGAGGYVDITQLPPKELPYTDQNPTAESGQNPTTDQSENIDEPAQ